jgi:hypothetical protein
MTKPGSSIWARYGFLWVTLSLFILSITGHWILAWHAYVQAQVEHGQTPEIASFLIEVVRDTLENWQSEFLQLAWQVSGLALLFHVRSPQSAENEARLELKIDAVLRAVDPDGADRRIKQLDRDYVR